MLKDNVIESIEDDSKAFDRLVEMAVYLIIANEPVIKRAGILRNQAKMESIPLSSKDVFLILAKARRDIEGIDEGEKPNVELDVSEESWLWDQLITEANLTLIVYMPKVGKSSLVGAFLGSIKGRGNNLLDLAYRCQVAGVGELIINNVDNDGQKMGFDIELMSQLNNKFAIPVVALGGCGQVNHIKDLIQKTSVSGVACSSLFIYTNE